MKTIPTSWKPGATTNRNLWYCNRGSPLIFIQIRRATGGYIRMSNRANYFYEDGSPHYYDDQFFLDMSPIDIGLNLSNNSVGCSGYISEIILRLNNAGDIGQKFTDTYDLDQLVNATVDIWFVPEEINATEPQYSYSNSLKSYTGKIISYVFNVDTTIIELKIDEYSITKQKRIPQRIIDWYNTVDQDETFDIPEKQKNEIVPMVFGNIIHPIQTIDYWDKTNRKIRAIIGYPISAVTPTTTKLYYWDNSKNKFMFIAMSPWDEQILENGGTPIEARLIKFLDLGELSTDFGQLIYLKPTIIDKFLYMTSEKSLEKITSGHLNYEYQHIVIDNAVIEDFISIIPWDSLVTTFRDVWQCYFGKENIPENILINFYLLMDVAWSDENYDDAVRINVKITPNINGGSLITALTGDFHKFDGGYYFWYNVPSRYGVGKDNSNKDYTFTVDPADGYTRNVGKWDNYIKIGATLSDITTQYLELLVAVKRTDDTSRVAAAQLHQLAIAMLPLDLMRDCFVGNDYDYDTIQEAIEVIFEQGMGLDPDDYVDFINFAENYDLDGCLVESRLSRDWLSQLAQEFGLFYYDDTDGVSRFIDFNPKAADYTITEADILAEMGCLQMTIEKSNQDIYSDFAVNYQKNFASGKYEKTKNLNKDIEDFATVDPLALQILCRNAYEDYDTDKKFELNLDFVREDDVAEKLLAKCIKHFTRRPTMVRFKSSLRICDLEGGDQIKFDTDIFSSDSNFYITKKVASYVYTNPIIEFEAMECPWTGV